MANADGRQKEVDVDIKMYRCQSNFPQMAQACYRELKLLQHMDYPNIARILDLYTPAQTAEDLYTIYLVLEHVGSTLEMLIAESIKSVSCVPPYPQVYVPMRAIPRIIRDTLCALQYLEAANVLHRSLKPSSIAVHGSGKAVLTDFGVETYFVSYAAPEVIFWTGGSYDRQADIWSLGCILVEMLIWERLFKDGSSVINLYISLFGPISADFMAKASETMMLYMQAPLNKNSIKSEEQRKMDEGEKRIDLAALKNYLATRSRVADLRKPEFEAVLDFIKLCLQYDPDTRITIQGALGHPFLSDIYVSEDLTHVQPLVYDDTERSIEDWQYELFSEIRNFQPLVDTPRPAIL